MFATIIKDQIRIAMGAITPASVTTYCYNYALDKTRNRLESSFANQNLKVWARNSFALGNAKFLQSDLDITIRTDNPLSRTEIENLNRLYRNQRRLFPFLSEINLYSKVADDQLKKDFNRFELSRDPALGQLLQVLPELSVRRKRAESFVFLLRMLTFDLDKLDKYKNSRVSKWNRYFSYTNLPAEFTADNFSTETIVKKACEHLEIAPKDQLEISSLFQAIRSNYKGFLNHQASEILQKHLKWGWILFPHYSCVSDCAARISLTEMEIEILDAEVRWECVGCYAQYGHSMNQGIFIEHLKNIKSGVSRLQTESALPLSSIETLNAWSLIIT